MQKHKSPYRKMDEEAEELAARLKKLRASLGYTQAEMASKFKIARITYHKWEHHGPPNTPAHRGYVRLMLAKLTMALAAKRSRERINAS